MSPVLKSPPLRISEDCDMQLATSLVRSSSSQLCELASWDPDTSLVPIGTLSVQKYPVIDPSWFEESSGQKAGHKYCSCRLLAPDSYSVTVKFWFPISTLPTGSMGYSEEAAIQWRYSQQDIVNCY